MIYLVKRTCDLGTYKFNIGSIYTIEPKHLKCICDFARGIFEPIETMPETEEDLFELSLVHGVTCRIDETITDDSYENLRFE